MIIGFGVKVLPIIKNVLHLVARGEVGHHRCGGRDKK